MRTHIADSCVEVKEPLGEAIEGLRMEELRHAIRRGWLVLHYQPRVDPRSAQVSVVEARLYWRHPALGYIPSIRFMPAAKTMGLADAFEEWTIRKVCEHGKKWQETGVLSVRLAVNVCAEHMACPSFVFFVTQCLSDSGFAPDKLELVLAMNDMAEHADKIIGPMHMLKESGVSLSIANIGGMGPPGWIM